MNYDEFLAGIDEYRELFEKGLKKQANKLLFKFAEEFKAGVPQKQADEILFSFCREYFDQKALPSALTHDQLPFQLTGLLNEYLNRECSEGKMPQMRWAFQLYGRYYNPHDPKNEHDPFDILKKAYEHPECDQKTVDLYFNEQVEWLYWGAHHFPDDCIITRESYRETVATAENILSEKTVDPALVQEFNYYVRLYELFYEWSDGGHEGDFGELCERSGLEFHAVKAFYYKK